MLREIEGSIRIVSDAIAYGKVEFCCDLYRVCASSYSPYGIILYTLMIAINNLSWSQIE